MIAAITFAMVGASFAQPPPPRDRRDQPKPPPQVRDRRDRDVPRKPPPAPPAETAGTRAGYVWITGHYEWRDGDYVWIPGHWERERAGKQWRAGQWQARGDRWVFTPGAWVDRDTSPPPPPPPAPPPAPPPRVDRPREAPPPPRAERKATRPGHVWVAGHWDWQRGKWEWVRGRLEPERPGHTWRDGRWERKGDTFEYVRGEWISATAPPPPGKRPGHARGRDRWKLEQPVVSSFWPAAGKPGTNVVIRGKNFPTNATVTWEGQPVRGAKITPTRITLTVPRDAASGVIALRAGGRRDLAIGRFEVAPTVDPEAERRRLEEERRRAAEAAWAARQQQLAADRAAREAALRRAQEERAASRERRRAERIAALQAQWQRAFLEDADTVAELTLHAQRVADLERMREIAEMLRDGKLAVRIDLARKREDDRHQQRMAALELAFGGRP